MQFRTEIHIPQSENRIFQHSEIITLGSCFAGVLGSFLVENKMKAVVNPLGTLFNPLSIFKILHKNYQLDTRSFVDTGDQCFHYDFHSSITAENPKELALVIENKIQNLHQQLAKSNFLILTFGTAFIHQLKEMPINVANCHKQPAAQFEKKLLSVKDICKGFAGFFEEIKLQNPSLQIVLTVSPVRHTKEGLAENQLSKSILRAACHYLETDYDGVNYFPAYEIMMDDLRDYRFYKSDLIHPNDMAEKYILDKFSVAYFDRALVDFIARWSKLKQAIQHRPFNVGSSSHQIFLRKTLKELESLSPELDLSEEIAQVKAMIL
ncbi:MAG: GSCFA domain-containing protein [Pseudarcicella sp.]|nr:GSCFA domain-containing protein [Pseudarcicella sp.]